MRYMVPREFWNEGSRFPVFDENRRPNLSVRDPEFSWDHHWTIEDLDRRKKLAYVNQEMAMSSATYVIFRDEQPWAEIPGSAFDSRINELRIDGPCEYVLRGQFWRREYDIRHEDDTLASIGPHRWSHSGMISIETNDSDDFTVLLIALTVEQILFG